MVSADVALAALASLIFASYAVHGSLPSLNHAITLFFAVIGIYTFDHLFDIWRVEESRLSSRRQFHAHHKSLLRWVSGASFLIALVASSTLPFRVQVAGVMIGLGMLVYFAILYWFRWHQVKDIGVSLGFVAGIWLPILAEYQAWNRLWLWLQITVFLLNTLQIMMIYAKVDAAIDAKENLESFVQSKRLFYYIGSKISPLFIILVYGLILTGEEVSMLFFVLPGLHFLLVRLVTRRKIQVFNPQTVRLLGEYSYLMYAVLVILA